MPASLTVDEPLLRGMARDASVYSLTRPWAIVMWAALAAALITSILNLSSAGTDADVLTAWMPVAVVALAAYAIWLTIANARRAVRAAMPPETTVWVEVGERLLRIGAARRRSEIPYEEFQSLRAGRDAVLLKVRTASVVTALPRALFTDEELAALRAKIG
ncbi:hypothetical protein QFZ53_001899 [Microbacterium natoriense]|uniref:YcxB-like protein domain-containing protein n=1 Tax=Microbacterium natoriense TaxID=284570 RepID=A0AAW8EWL3_9MICO|nr:YcxB family protein [Microbacterium natoriense]MDQ0647703.1 hypothetical protein [Microbacterium natoriense]